GLELYGFWPGSQVRRNASTGLFWPSRPPKWPEWLKVYNDGRYAEVDPTVRLLRHSVTPLEHNEILRLGATSNRAHAAQKGFRVRQRTFNPDPRSSWQHWLLS